MPERVQAQKRQLCATIGAGELPLRYRQSVTRPSFSDGGRDTDTVAAIAGSLIGATTGISGIPAAWRRKLHGWPGLTTRDLMARAVLAANGGASDRQGWPADATIEATSVDTLVRHPHDDGVWLGSLAALRRLPDEVDAVVSLCRVGHHETDLETVEFWLVDRAGANVHLRSIVEDAADTIAALRAEGRTVFVHCAEGRSRTPTVAAAYSIRHLDRDPQRALAEVVTALPGEHINGEFRKLVASIRSDYVRTCGGMLPGDDSETSNSVDG